MSRRPDRSARRRDEAVVQELVKGQGWREDLARAAVQDPTFRDRYGALCNALVGALAFEIRLNPDPDADFGETDLSQMLELEPDASTDDVLVETWNEQFGRTQADVVALLDSAIARRRRQLRQRRKRARWR